MSSTIPPEATPDVDSFLASPTPVVSPQAPPSNEPAGLDDFIKEELQGEKYSGIEQGAKAFGEGALRGALGPVGTFVENRLYHVPKEDILGREKQRSGLAGAGEAAGLIGSTLIPVGEGAALAKIGHATTDALGLGKATSFTSKIGSEAVNQAIQMGIYQSGDEISKKILDDPDQSAQSALAHVGLASALGGVGGGVLGAVSPLWSATAGPQVEAMFKNLSSRLGGREGVAAESALLGEKAGISIPPEIQAKLDGDPIAANLHSKLNQTDTTYAGRKYQEALEGFRSGLGESVVEALGKEPKYLNELPELNKYDVGQKLGDDLHKEISEQIKPISDAYESTNETFKKSFVNQDILSQTAESIAQKSLEQGWHKAESDAQVNLMKRVLGKLPEQQTAEDLKKFITNLRDAHPFGSPTYQAAKDIRAILGEAQEKAIESGIVAKGDTPQAVEGAISQYKALKGQYLELMNSLDNLNEHLHVGRYDGPKSFLQALKELSTTNGEGVLNRLAGENKAQILDLLAQKYPNTLARVREYHLNKALSAGIEGGEALNPSKFLSKYQKLTPQVKALVANPEQQGRLDAIGQIVEGLKDPTHNFSNTARTADKIAHGSPNPLSLLAAALGHGGEAILAHIGKLGFNEGSDAIRLGLLKFLGSKQPIKAEGIKSAVNYFDKVYKGEKMLGKAMDNIFKPGARVLADSYIPTSSSLAKLDKLVAQRQNQPNEQLHANDTSHLGHYADQHQTAVVSSTTRALQYCQALKPQPQKPGPLNTEIKPSSAQEARYKRCLTIAQQPATILEHIKEGTIQASDIQDLNTMYPALYQKMTKDITNAMVNKVNNEEVIPYKTRIGISLFLGQPIDSSMSPGSIQSAQPKPQQTPQQMPAKKGKSSSSLNKMSNSYKTPGQAAESDRSSRE